MGMQRRDAAPLGDGTRAEVERNIAAQIPALTRFARRLVGPRGDVEDLVQDTLLKALSASGQFRPGTALKSWLFTIMRNTFCTAYRVRQREQVGLPDALVAVLGVPPSQDWAIRRIEMEEALDRMPGGVRQALLLISFGSSYDETARICRCEVGTVKSRVNRARKSLVDELGSLTVH
ncbi:sigma-70 family RNA polymerase sigma factor [Neorhizobium sp. NCHU2750]|uniref:sigma-70 family RNA polymerase sigma factor n=1 Tax=Neorhizobium sp. NCHU2750 TaxID=1825976 RepID=UPI000E71DD84|nr:RNA polymerase sigma factor [Neorhizobium sp. NCHU2750]